MINFGAIIWIRDFYFENTGVTKNKYIVVISDEYEGHYITVVLTSQQTHWRYPVLGCNVEKRWFYIGANHPRMKKRTWADLSRSWPFEASELIHRAMSARARPCGTFEHDLVVSIAECFAQTEDVTDFDLEAMGFPPDP